MLHIPRSNFVFDLHAAVDFGWLKFNFFDCAILSLVFQLFGFFFANGIAWHDWIGRYAHEENPAEWKERGTGEV